jgi:hypothetical protein
MIENEANFHRRLHAQREQQWAAARAYRRRTINGSLLRAVWLWPFIFLFTKADNEAEDYPHPRSVASAAGHLAILIVLFVSAYAMFPLISTVVVAAITFIARSQAPSNL